MLAQRRRLWADISQALGQRLVFAGATSACTIESTGQTETAGQNATDTLSRQR